MWSPRYCFLLELVKCTSIDALHGGRNEEHEILRQVENAIAADGARAMCQIASNEQTPFLTIGA